MQPQKTVLYFGYAENRSPAMMAAITGRNEQDLLGFPETILEDYELCVQNIDQIPKIPQRVILNYWETLGESYRASVIRPKKGSQVRGRVYNLTEKEMELVRNNNFIELGMQHEIKVKVPSASKLGQYEVITGILEDGQTISEIIDGLASSDFLNHRETTLNVAIKRREDFIRKLEEGSMRPPEIKG